MTDLGDLLGLPADPFPAARRRAARGQVPCRNPWCGRPVFVDRAVYGYGEGCAEQLGLVVHRHRTGAPVQTGRDLLAELDAIAAGRVDQVDDDPAGE